MSAIAEFKKIVDTRDEGLRGLQKLEKPLLARATDLSDKQRNGTALTAAEADDLATANTNLDRIHHGMWVIGQISIQAMNDSTLLRDISNSLNGISSDLKKTKAKLDKIAKIADITAKVTAVLVELAEKVGKAMVI
jgi:Skp family chaperone for outer membrane proteins